MNKKASREIKTLAAMMKIYCRDRHGSKEELCPGCKELFNYARERIVNCRLEEQKTTCARCKIHCFKPGYREQIREIMRHSGPKMIYRHPYLALCHLFDSLFKF